MQKLDELLDKLELQGIRTREWRAKYLEGKDCRKAQPLARGDLLQAKNKTVADSRERPATKNTRSIKEHGNEPGDTRHAERY